MSFLKGREFGVSYPTNTIVYAQSKTKDGCLPVGKTLMAGTVFAIHRLALPQAQDLFHATLSDCLHRLVAQFSFVHTFHTYTVSGILHTFHTYIMLCVHKYIAVLVDES